MASPLAAGVGGGRTDETGTSYNSPGVCFPARDSSTHPRSALTSP